MLKSLPSLLLLLLCFTSVKAQESYADSLRMELAHAKEDTNKVLTLVNLAYVYQWS
jgi:hypothetical protein